MSALPPAAAPPVSAPAWDWRVDGLSLRVILGAVAFLLLPLAAALAWREWDAEKASAIEQTRHVSELLATATEQTFDTHLANLRALAPTLAVPAARGDYAQVTRILGEFKANYVVLAGLSMLAADGQLLATTLIPHQPGAALPHIQFTPGAMDSFATQIHPRPSMNLRPIKTALTGEWVIPLRHAVRDAAGRPLFVLTALLSMERLAASLQPVSAPPDAVYLLMNTAGYRVLRIPAPADPGSYYPQARSDALAIQLMANPQARSGAYEIAGTPDDESAIGATGSYTRLKNYSLGAAVSMPKRLWAEWWKAITFPLAVLGGLLLAVLAVRTTVARMEQRQRAVRQAADERLHEADLRLSLAVDAGRLAIWEADLVSGHIFFDRGWENNSALAVDASSLTWAEFALLLRAQDIAAWQAKAKPLLDGGIDAFHEEVEMRARSGEWRWFSVRGRVTARGADGRALACIGTAGDITRRKQTRQALETARLAAEAESQAKSAFFARIGHEVRTPVHGMLGMIELLTSTELTADQGKLAAAVRGSGTHLMQVVEDLLDFARLEAGQLQLDTVMFDVRHAVDATLQPLRVQVQDKNLILQCEIAPDVPARVRADPVRLGKVLTQVIGNAVKFTDEGRIDVRVSAAPRGDDAVTLRFSVADTGAGIAPDLRGAIFDAFVQADTGTTRKYGGSGLGLSLCKALLGLMGGDIRLVRSSSAGSIFEFTVTAGVEVKAACGAAEREPRPDELQALLRGLNVLVVDDNTVNRAVAKGMLDSLKCDVDMVINGPEAVSASAAKAYDMILMDCNMPEMDGLEATARIRSREKASSAPRVPIIALTGNTEPGSRENCINAGMDDFLAKPYSCAALAQVIARRVSRRTESCPIL